MMDYEVIRLVVDCHDTRGLMWTPESEGADFPNFVCENPRLWISQDRLVVGGAPVTASHPTEQFVICELYTRIRKAYRMRDTSSSRGLALSKLTAMLEAKTP